MKMQVFGGIWRLRSLGNVRLNAWVRVWGLNQALNPDPTSEFGSEKDKIQVQRHRGGNVSREVSTEVQMWRKGADSVKSTGPQ